MYEWNIGFEVMLKSGGYKMTIESISWFGNKVTCVYFNEKGELNKHTFKKDMLRRI